MKTPRNIRLKLTYADPDFEKAARSIHDKFILELKAKRRPQSYIDNIQDGYIHSSSMQNYASPLLNEEYRELLRVYDLTSGDFINFFTQEEAMEEDGSERDYDTPIIINMPSPEDTMLTIQLHPNVTKQDLLDHWRAIKETIDWNFNKSKKLRLRGPDNLPLLWAIHKSKLQGQSNHDIARRICDNTLPQYDHQKGAKKQWTENEVKQYYYDYKEYVVKHTN